MSYDNRKISGMSEAPAEKVVRVFGGIDAVADIVGLSTVQVRRWAYPTEKGGHGGQVPTRHHSTLLASARQRGIRLSPEDLIPWLREAS